jgi:hypothetical protein
MVLRRQAMMQGTWQKSIGRIGLFFGLLVSVAMGTSSASAQLLYSFEPGLEGWGPTLFDGSDLISVSQSTLGPTLGTRSMAVERGNAIGNTQPHSWDVNRTVTPGDTPGLYSIFQTVAASPTRYALDFDVTITPESFAQVASPGPFFSINLSANSSTSGENGWNQHDNVVPVTSAPGDYNLIGAGPMGEFQPEIGTHHYSIPLVESLGGSGLYLAPNATFYQLNLGSNLNNTLFQNGPNGEGARYFVDNIHFRELPETVEKTLFSWETPDNSATPTVNEQFEGWVEGYHEGHDHSLVSTGATHGSTALQIDRTPLEAGFAWGSQFLISSDTNPDPEIETIDPAIQARIDQLTDDILNAQSVAFDITYMYTDQFPAPAPEFTKFGLHFTDESGGQFQAEQQGFISIPTGTPETTVTIEIPLNSFTLYPTGELLLDEGFVEGTNFFRIGLSTNTNGAQIYQIDNFRLISLAPEGLSGDFNDDGKVDAADYVVWRKNDSANVPLPNDDGLTNQAARYGLWQTNFGSTSAPGGGGESAVPEPASAALLLLAVAGAMAARGRRRA